MTVQNQGILALIRSGLEGKRYPIPQGFSLEQAVTPIAVHGMLGLAFLGAKQCGYSMKDPAMALLASCFVPELSRIRKQTQALETLFSFLEEQQVDFMPIKGAIIRGLYPKPELRSMSDADILIRDSQYPVIRRALVEAGYTESKGEENEYVWGSGGVLFEFHNQLIPYSDERYGGYYTDSWRFAVKRPGSTRYDFREEDHFVFQFLHFAKHYRFGTITAKNVVDFHVFSQAYPNMDMVYIRAELDRLGLLGFYENISRLLQVWFYDAPEDAVTALLTETIFQGSILSVEESEACYRLEENRADPGKGFRGRLMWILRSLFPRYRVMAYRYPVLKKCPIALPLLWLWRMIHFAAVILTGRKTESVSIRGMSVEEAKMNLYREQLTRVGL